MIPTYCAQCHAPFVPPIGLYGTNDVACPACCGCGAKPCYTALPPAAVALVIDNDQRVLTVTNRHYGGSAFPGGKVEEQDDQPGRNWGPGIPGFACVRELKEETGLIAAPHNLRQVYVGPGSFETGRLVFMFYVHLVVGAPRAQEPGTKVEWMSWDKLCEVGVFAPYYKTAFPQGIDMFRATKMKG